MVENVGNDPTHQDCKSRAQPIWIPRYLVPSAGLKPATLGVEIRCSIQLSYKGKNGAAKGIQTPTVGLEDRHAIIKHHSRIKTGTPGQIRTDT